MRILWLGKARINAWIGSPFIRDLILVVKFQISSKVSTFGARVMIRAFVKPHNSLGTFRSDYEYEIEYEYDFSILVFRLHIIATYTHFIP